MRSSLLLVTGAVLLAFLAGYLSLSVVRTPRSSEQAIAAVVGLKKDFQRTHEPRSRVNLESVFRAPGALSLIDPGATLAGSVQYPVKELRTLSTYATSCDPSEKFRSHAGPLHKAWAWHLYRCGAKQSLGSDFFSTEPYMHPSGASFAFLAYQAGVSTDLRYAHLLELSNSKNAAMALSEPMEFLRGLDLVSLNGLWLGDSLVIGNQYVYFREPTPTERTGPGIYKTYRRGEWDDFLQRNPYVVSYQSLDGACLMKDGSLCWQYAFGRFFGSVNRVVGSLLLGLLFLIASVIWMLFQRLHQQKENEEEKRFALRTLTHELRTPITSMALSIESLRGSFDRLPEEEQSAFLRICDDVQRIRRLMEGSRRFLRSSEDEAPPFMAEPIDSIHTYFSHLFEPFEGKLEVSLPEKDGTFTADRYWLGVCVTNLVENALLHGRPPTAVNVRNDSVEFSVTVQDQGECEFSDLKEMAKSFVKGSESKGLGLGLAIVREVAQKIGGSLDFESKPTRFTLRFRKDENS